MENKKLSDVKRHSVSGYGRQDINYNDPEGEFVYYEDYAVLQQKLDAMAAENASLKESVEHAAGCIHAAEVEGLQDALESRDGERLYDLVHRRLWHAYLPTETPATDTYLNSVRAEGVGLVKSHPAISLVSLTHICDQIAEQLRSGTHDTADKAG